MDELGGGLFAPLTGRQFKALWSQFRHVHPLQDDRGRPTDDIAKASWQWPYSRHAVHTRKDVERAGVNVVEWWELPEEDD